MLVTVNDLMCKIPKSKRQCHNASYCCIPRCADLSSDARVCALCHTISPIFARFLGGSPSTQFNAPRRSICCLRKATSWIASQANRKAGEQKTVPRHQSWTRLHWGQLCRGSLCVICLWCLPREAETTRLGNARCPLVSLLILNSQKQMKKVIKIVRLSLTPRCCCGVWVKDSY